MKKNISIYIFMIILIAALAVLMNSHQWASLFLNTKFPHRLHIILEGSNSLLMLLIFLVSNHLYSKTEDERLIIMGGGFLVGSILNTIHIITITTFPYDFISIANLQKNISIIYLLFGNLILPVSIYFAFIHKPSTLNTQDFRFKTYSTYFFIFLALIITPFLSHYFVPAIKYELNITMHALEFINYSLYIMLAFIVINIRQSSNLTFFPTFTTGLIISGLSGLFYINPSLVQFNEILAHIFQSLGLIFLFAGITHFQTYTKFLKFKDELAAYLCLLLIAFYIVFIAITSGALHIIFPTFSAYIFIEFLLIFQFIIYLLSNKLTLAVTNITETLNEYEPGEEPIIIPITRLDEIGLLTEKINAVSTLSWQSISTMYKMARRERSIRRIFESMQSISDQNEIKNIIIDEINKAFDADRCFIALYDPINNCFYFDRYSEYLPPEIYVNYKIINDYDLNIKQVNDLFKSNIEVCFANVEEYIVENSLQGTPREKLLREYNIKSSCNIPIYYANNLLGYLIIQFTNDYKEFKKDDFAFLKTMATQIGIAINQADTYETKQTQTESEGISEIDVETLKAHKSKNIIKRFFVKNIGKLFNADRVFFSEYDPEKEIYLPVNIDSEYLSSTKEKSFVNFDFTDESVREYIQPLMEKRELNIFRWDEYNQENSKTDGMIARFEKANVKSSYNIPVLYEERLMGYFCIEYTHKVNTLSEEDLNKIRNICAQTGIALYHLDLYINSKDALLKEIEAVASILLQVSSNILKD